MLVIVHWVFEMSPVISAGTLLILVGEGCFFAHLRPDDDDDDDGEDEGAENPADDGDCGITAVLPGCATCVGGGGGSICRFLRWFCYCPDFHVWVKW